MNMEDTKVEEGFKRCSRCGQVKPITEFSERKDSLDGRRGVCKQCDKEYKANYYQAHKKRLAMLNVEWYKANKENVKSYQKEYRQTNKERLAEYKANYYHTNKERLTQSRADYYAKNKERLKAKYAEYRARRKGKKAVYDAKYRQANKERIKENKFNYTDPTVNPLGFAKYMVNNYRKQDRDRFGDDSNTITAEWFLENIAYKPCAHCGKQGIGLVGVNRLDNSKPHIPSNCEPCCRSCNMRENIRDQIERGVHVSCKHKKQSFKEFVEEHKAKNKNLT